MPDIAFFIKSVWDVAATQISRIRLSRNKVVVGEPVAWNEKGLFIKIKK